MFGEQRATSLIKYFNMTLQHIARTPYIVIEGRPLFFKEVDGEWWIAVKPICEALGLPWKDYHDQLKRDPILGELSAPQRIVAADGKARMMTCLPERYVYGWVFQLPSRKPTLLAFKHRCYDAIYNYFHGAVSQRRTALLEKARAIAEQRRLRRELESDPRYQRLMQLEGVVLSQSRMLKEQDRVMEVEQLRLFDMESALE
jgi:hypothetical protein